MSELEPKTKTQPHIVVFTTPTCPWCQRVKQYLKAKGFQYREVDVTRNQAAARDLVRMTGQMGVPVTMIGARTIVGFDRAQIDRLLGIRA